MTCIFVVIAYMHWSASPGQALPPLASAASTVQGEASPGSHARAKGSRVRARPRRCCGASCVAGMRAPLAAIFWQGCGYPCCWPLKHAPLRRGVISPLRVHAFVWLRAAAGLRFPQVRVRSMRTGKSTALNLAHTNLRPARPIPAQIWSATVQ